MYMVYEHGGDVYRNKVRLDFSVNTNPLGMSKNVKKAIAENIEQFGIYPDAMCINLRNAIAEKEQVGIDNVLCSNGAAEMIFAVVRAVMPKKSLLLAPTFSEYERALKSVSSQICYYYLKEENDFELQDDFIDYLDDIDMVFICNPNNPVGKVADKKTAQHIAEVCSERNIVCVFDECFMDLSDGFSMKEKVPVIKAFTKTYAMAGLRLGYMIADTDFVCDVQRQLPMWNVSAAAQIGGITAINDNDYLEKGKQIIREEREFLIGELKNLGFKVFNSDVNFILFKGSVGLDKSLLKREILIRNCGNFNGLDEGFYRIAVKKHDENAEFIRELGDICG